MNETIAAVATAHGVGSISIIRLSGADALSLALKLTKLTKLTSLVPRYATLTKIYAEGELIDEALLIYFKAPHSFTGEDVVEFQLHGGLVVANLILGELIKNGARLARAGEVSKRALINGKMDFSEAINSLINAKSEDSVKIIARTMRGDLAKFANEIRSELVKTLAFVETSIDYADDDLPADLLESISQMLKQNSAKLDKIVAISQSRKGLLEGFKIAIVGKPNVGKSSILNSLLSYERAIISDEAGTTRDSSEEALKIGTHLVRIIDTAGIRKKGKVNEDLEYYSVIRSIRAIENSDVCLLMLDATRGIESQDLNIFSIIRKNKKGLIVCVNKWDLVEDKSTAAIKTYERAIRERMAPFTDFPILFISALTKQRIFKVLETAKAVYDNRRRRVTTGRLNETMLPIIEQTPPPAWKGKYIKIKYITQLPAGSVPSFAFFCNLPQWVKEPYRRFLENQLREHWDFHGTPIQVFIREK